MCSLIGICGPMRLDQLADVVPLRFEGQPGERTGNRDTRRERRIFVDREGFLVSRDGHDALSGLRHHRATPTQVIEVRVRIGNQ